jgi:osmotically-inducible protein OsmY
MKALVFRLICQAVLCTTFCCLTVGLSFVESAFSEELSEKVSNQLEDVTLGAHDLDITTRSGDVTIAGWVSSEKDRQTILDTIRSMKGVDKVIDALQVDDAKAPKIIYDDRLVVEARIAEVGAAVESYLQGINLKGHYSLQYELTEQGVLIKGELPAGTEKQAMLYQVRRNVSTPVNENITVRAWPSDNDLMHQVRTQLGVKQGLDLHGISISVYNGVVTLSGKRSNHSEADQLVAAVLMVEGVRDVKSEVTFGGSRSDP